MSELPSRGERFINHTIDYRADKAVDLAAHGKADNKWVADAIYYLALCHNPDLFESMEESEDRGIPFTGSIYKFENPHRSMGDTQDLDDMYPQDKQYPDSPIGNVPRR